MLSHIHAQLMICATLLILSGACTATKSSHTLVTPARSAAPKITVQSREWGSAQVLRLVDGPFVVTDFTPSDSISPRNNGSYPLCALVPKSYTPKDDTTLDLKELGTFPVAIGVDQYMLCVQPKRASLRRVTYSGYVPQPDYRP